MIANQSMIQVFVGVVFNKVFKVRAILFFKRVAEYLSTPGSCRDEGQAFLKTEPGEINYFLC